MKRRSRNAQTEWWIFLEIESFFISWISLTLFLMILFSIEWFLWYLNAKSGIAHSVVILVLGYDSGCVCCITQRSHRPWKKVDSCIKFDKITWQELGDPLPRHGEAKEATFPPMQLSSVILAMYRVKSATFNGQRVWKYYPWTWSPKRRSI